MARMGIAVVPGLPTGVRGRHGLTPRNPRGREADPIPGDLDDTITVDGANRKIFIAPSTIEGVEFRYLTEINKKGFKKSITTPMSNFDPRLVVFLWKLARSLSRDFNVDTIYHIGSLGKNPNNCHGQGRAMDFARGRARLRPDHRRRLVQPAGNAPERLLRSQDQEDHRERHGPSRLAPGAFPGSLFPAGRPPQSQP